MSEERTPYLRTATGKQPKYRFKTLAEMDKEIEINYGGHYKVGEASFIEDMFHLAGLPIPDEFSEQIMSSPYGIELDLGDIVFGKENFWKFIPQMLTLNEAARTGVICCGVLEKMSLGWMELKDGTKCMPYINGHSDENMYRVNHCPSCGKYVRDAVVKP